MFSHFPPLSHYQTQQGFQVQVELPSPGSARVAPSDPTAFGRQACPVSLLWSWNVGSELLEPMKNGGGSYDSI